MLIRGSARLLFLAPAAYPFGGVADWLDYLLPGLSALRWECTLGLVDGRYHDVDAYLSRHPWEQVVRIKNPTGSREGRIQALMATIARTRPDILAVVNIVDAYAAVRRLRLSGKPSPRLVATLHGLQSDLLSDLRDEADVIEAVVSPNRLAVKLAGQAIGADARALYAPCGVSLSDDADSIEHQSRGALRLLYSGRLEQEQKRILDLPEILEALRGHGIETHLALAGGGPDEATLRSKFESMGLLNQVSFLGVLNPHDLAQEYRRHDALVITSVWETGPIVAWEAMSHGLPVLTSRYVGSGLEAALVDGVNSLLFPVGDIQAAARAAMKLTQPGIHARLVQGALDLLQQRYSRAVSVAQWHDAFNQIRDLPLLPSPSLRPPHSPSGRLDRWLGAAMGQHARRVLGLSYQHHEPGGEWPHTTHAHEGQIDFLLRAAALDKSGLQAAS
ncbi:MAG: glycosyltransferase [Thiobacillus sp.]|nr:glycosyltransferase [Thiobacillus sp.]